LFIEVTYLIFNAANRKPERPIVGGHGGAKAHKGQVACIGTANRT
jgi:hypothetical protein